MVGFSYAPGLSSLSSSILLTTLLSNMAVGHLFISSPVPIAGSAPKDPLEASGSNFPCHGVSLPSSGGAPMKAGSSHELQFALGADFANTAVHGGGSCQLSLTYETDPAKVKDASNWHVIYSIEGGCPSNTKGNLVAPVSYCTSGNVENGDCINSFNYTIPSGVKSGNAILAWTWFNTVGNREMYMNCANVDISGGDGSEMGSLPSMFVANMASLQPADKCPTTESINVGFPNAGKYVTTQSAKNAYNYPIAAPTGAGCPAAAGGASTTSSPYGGAPSTSASPSYSPPAYTSPPVASTSSYAAPTSYGPPPTMSTVTGSSPSGAVVPSGSSNDTYGSGSGTSCTEEGAVVCIGTTSFGICDHGMAVPQALAPGTSCSGGAISRKRVIRHAARHFGGH